jgi:lipopolysaccharide/colanic/teichoic acid biosynthesis glycosyltransferase
VRIVQRIDEGAVAPRRQKLRWIAKESNLPPHHVSEASQPRANNSGARQHAPRSKRIGRELQASNEAVMDAAVTHEAIPRELRLHPVRAEAGTTAIPRPHPIRRNGWAESVFRRAFDLVGALILGVVFAPLMIVIALLLKHRHGSIIYRHRRIGREGRAFECLKFRTMIVDADSVLGELLDRHPEMRAEWVRDQKLRHDPRITPVGRFLRHTSLDELPQLWNVIRGEMSLVGPRPVVREELMRYGRNLPTYLSARPGITGLWQVMGRNTTTYRRRVALDVYYVRKQNVLLDLFILLKTTRVVVTGGGGAY